MRKLSAEEDALWQRVAATIRPLGATAPDASAVNPPLREPIHPPERIVARPSLALGETLDGGWERRLRSGTVEPDRTLDLHGFTVDRAYTAIDRLLEHAWSAGERVVLLVPGRERGDPAATGRGKIRAALRDWLHASRHAPHIAAIRPAHRRHGGAGGVYVILRRR